MSNPNSTYPIRTRKVHGELKQYYAMPFIWGWIASYTYLGFINGIDVPPPPFRHRPLYPKTLEEGKGVAVVNSPWFKVIPAIFISAFIVLMTLTIAIVANNLGLLFLLVLLIPGLCLWVWWEYAHRICTAMVFRTDSVALFTRIYATEIKTVQGADLNSIDVRSPNPNLLVNILARKLDIWVVEVTFETSSELELENPGENRKGMRLRFRKKDSGRFVLRTIGNGEAVNALLTILLTSWESSLRRAADTAAASLSLDEQAFEVTQKLAAGINRLGELTVDQINRSRKTNADILEALTDIRQLLKRIAAQVAPEPITESIPVQTMDSSPEDGPDSPNNLPET